MDKPTGTPCYACGQLEYPYRISFTYEQFKAVFEEIYMLDAVLKVDEGFEKMFHDWMRNDYPNMELLNNEPEA